MYMNDNASSLRSGNEEMLRRILDNSEQIPPSSPQGRRSWGLKNYPLASVYAPLQEFADLYDPLTALKKGTLFSQLELPFMGKTIAKEGR